MGSIDTLLRQAKLRSTVARRRILRLLQEGQPLTATGILAHFRQEAITIDPATVYRQLEILSAKKLLRPLILQEGVTHYEAAFAESGHHHHLVCDGCGKVEHVQIGELEQALQRLESELCRQAGWRSAVHRLEFPGTCGTCAEPRPQSPSFLRK